MITKAALIEALKDLPENAPILVKPHDGKIFANSPFAYDTRELQLAYQANDDRYTQHHVLLLEFGELSNDSAV